MDARLFRFEQVFVLEAPSFVIPLMGMADIVAAGYMRKVVDGIMISTPLLANV